MFPSGSHLPRSPVRYIRPPTSSVNGSFRNLSAVNSGRFRYPRATPAPPMYSSPITPTGTGSFQASSMYIRVFAIGRPIETPSSTLLICFIRDQIVVSVGPYIFQTEKLRVINFLARLLRKTSPPQRALRLD